MTGVLANAANSVKNFFLQISPFGNSARRENRGHQDQGQEDWAPSRLYSVNTGNSTNYSRKRPLERFIEIEKDWEEKRTCRVRAVQHGEIGGHTYSRPSSSAHEVVTLTLTDDEDEDEEVLPRCSKKLKESTSQSMSKSSNPGSSSRNPECIELEASPVSKSQSSQSLARGPSFASFRFEPRPPQPQKNKEDDSQASTKSKSGSGGGGSAVGELERMRRKFDSVMIQKDKPKMKQKFISKLTGVGRKAVDPICTMVRQEELDVYRVMVENSTQASFSSRLFGRALRRSKMEPREVSAMYHNWSSPQSPKVSLSFIPRDRDRGSLYSERQTPQRVRQDEDLKLFSTPDSAPSTWDKNEDEGEEVKVDDEITIVKEIPSPLKNRSIRQYNSLALEQNQSPYVSGTWLNQVSSSFRDNMKMREKEITEKLTTFEILNKESTLEKDLREDIRRKLSLTERLILEEEAPSRPTLPALTEDQKIIIKRAKLPGREDEVLSKVFNIDFTRGDVKTLAPTQWLNDNVINAHMELVSHRSKQDEDLPNVYVFSTFFYPKLLKEGYSNALKRWTRKVDIFEHDLIIFPIHLGLHWCLACADLRIKHVNYYDSLGGKNDRCLNVLLDYLAREMKERKGVILNREEWTVQNVPNVPQQKNGSDCGVFTCKFAEYLSRDAELTFGQENMNYFRDRMIYEIIQKDLIHP